MKRPRSTSLLDRSVLWPALLDSLRKLAPWLVFRSPVMFVVEVGSVLTSLIWLRDLLGHGRPAEPLWFTGLVTIWLWFTVVFANFSEAMAEGRGKAQAAFLRRRRKEMGARRLRDGREERLPASLLRKGDRVFVEAGEAI